MADKAPKADKELSVPDRIRNTGVRVQMLVRSVHSLQGVQECGRETRARKLVSMWQESNALGEAMLDLSEYFSAGYLELCRCAQLVRTPMYWGWRNASVQAPSFHAAAINWCQRKVDVLLARLLGVATDKTWLPTHLPAGRKPPPIPYHPQTPETAPATTLASPHPDYDA